MERGNGRMVEWWNGGMVEWWSGGVVEWWNRGMAEWWHVGKTLQILKVGITERWNGGKNLHNPKRRGDLKSPEILIDGMIKNYPKS